MKEMAQQVKSIDFKAKKAKRNEETSVKNQIIMIYKLKWEKCMAENQQQDRKNPSIMRS